MINTNLTDEQKDNLACFCDILDLDGAYEQGKQKLKDGDFFCVVGVAQDLWFQATGKGSWSKDDGILIDGIPSGKRYPSLQLSDFFGFELIYGTVPSLQVYLTDEEKQNLRALTNAPGLFSLNDSYGLSFKEIAHLIRRTYLT